MSLEQTQYLPRKICFKLYIEPSGSVVEYFTWVSTRENLSSGVANNTGADQPAHWRSLISAFVIHFLKSIMCKLAIGEISIF